MAMQPKRPHEHARNARRSKEHSYLFHWIRLLQSAGHEPAFLTLEELPDGTARHFVGLVERMYINSLRRIGHRLTNISEGGFGGNAGPVSDETRKKLSDTMRGRVKSVEHRAALSLAKKGRPGLPQSQETKEKRRIAVTGRKYPDRKKPEYSEEGRKRHAEAVARRWEDPLQHAAMSERSKSQVHTPEHIAKFSETRRGHVVTEETRSKLSGALKGRPLSPEHRVAIGIGQTGRVFTEDTCKKISESNKSRWADPVYRAETSARMRGAKKRKADAARLCVENSDSTCIPPSACPGQAV